MGGKTLLEFPSSEKVKPYKAKSVHIIAYIYLIGGVCLVVGETGMIPVLAMVHLLHAFMRHNFMNVDPVAAQVKYDNMRRSFWIDMVVFFMLLLVGTEKHPMAGEIGKNTKVDKSKLKDKDE